MFCGGRVMPIYREASELVLVRTLRRAFLGFRVTRGFFTYLLLRQYILPLLMLGEPGLRQSVNGRILARIEATAGSSSVTRQPSPVDVIPEVDYGKRMEKMCVLQYPGEGKCFGDDNVDFFRFQEAGEEE